MSYFGIEDREMCCNMFPTLIRQGIIIASTVSKLAYDAEQVGKVRNRCYGNRAIVISNMFTYKGECFS